MIDLKDFILNKHNQKKYKFYCDSCGKDRGYLFKTARGGRKTGKYCVTCKNSTQRVVKNDGYCHNCNDTYKLPQSGSSNSHWYWENNKNSIKNGYFRCKIAINIKGAAGTAKRRASKISATPNWLTNSQIKEIADKYALSKKMSSITKIDYHVDHIIPLQGDNVCGLHVPWNLRVIKGQLNLTKGNKLLNDIMDSKDIEE